MRQDCKFYETRTYASGDTVRKCDLDLAPEAPWRCPDDCKAYVRRTADVGFQHGSLVAPPVSEPASVGEDDSIAALLDSAEEIVRNAGPAVVADLEAERQKQKKKQRSAKLNGMRAKFGNLGQYLRDQRKKGR